MPKLFLDKRIQFFLATRDDSIATGHAMPNGIIGYSDVVDDTLKKLYFAKEKKPASIPISWK